MIKIILNILHIILIFLYYFNISDPDSTKTDVNDVGVLLFDLIRVTL